ncbi:putative C-S lyase [bacterium]|nr:putative C-S lyase [bacterium]
MRPPAEPPAAFDSCPDRRGTGSEKWDRWSGRDVLPVWVADMDFRTADEVLAAVGERVDHGVFGYTHEPPGFRPALAEHLARRHGWQVDPASIVGVPGVVTALALTARLLSSREEGVLSFTPVYPPFLTLPGLAGRKSVRVPLVQGDLAWTIDSRALESAASTSTAKILWLCHPHNPTGTVWSRADLLGIADVADRHGLTVVSDEIWADLVLDEDHPHVPFASLDHPAASQAITLVAPSKTWNLAGLSCAAAIVPDVALRRRWRAAGEGLVPMVNPLGYAAAEAAWRHGEAWRRRLLDVLRRHRALVLDRVAVIPGLSCIPWQATYLAWIDCRGTGVADPQAACEAAGLGTSDGRDFGLPGFVRLNTACPEGRLLLALDRLAAAFAR